MKRCVLAVLCFVVIGSGVLTLACPVFAGSSGPSVPDTSAVVGRANEYGRAVRTGELIVRTEATFLEEPDENFTDERKIWFDGLRSRVEVRVRRPKAKEQDRRTEEYWTLFDGERAIRATPPDFERVSVTVPNDLSELPRYVAAAGRVIGDVIGPALSHSLPLGDTIAAWGGELVGEEQIQGLWCVRLTSRAFERPKYRTVRSWWLAPDKGYALVQYSEVTTWFSGKTSAKHTVSLVDEWLHTNDGVWMPKAVSVRVYIKHRGGDLASLRRIDRIELLSAAINGPVSDEVFAVQLPEAVKQALTE